MGAMLFIEVAHEKKWTYLWLESASKLVNFAFMQPNIIPWNLQNWQHNFLHFLRNTFFKISHIFGEHNCCGDRITNLDYLFLVSLGGMMTKCHMIF